MRKTDGWAESGNFGDGRGWKREGRKWWQVLTSTGVVDNGRGGRDLCSSACLDKKWLEASDYVGCDEFFEDMITTGLQIRNGLFKGKNCSASRKIMTKASGCGVISAKEVFDV